MGEQKEIRLTPWSELVGTFFGIEVGESEVSVALSCKNEHVVISFPKDIPELEVLRTRLSSVRLGARVGLLRTDKAFYIRLIETARDDTH